MYWLPVTEYKLIISISNSENHEKSFIQLYNLHFAFCNKIIATFTMNLSKYSFFLFFSFLFSLFTFHSNAQGVTKYGQSTSSSANFVDKNGKIGSSPALSKYGQVLVLATLTTTTASSITSTTATSGGNVTSDGGTTITARGVCWATTSTPTTAGSKTIDTGTTGIFTSSITALTAGTVYYVRAYATNSAGTSYGNEVTFTTATVPGAPTIGTATAGNAQAAVAFTAPASNGGSAITGYTVTSSTGGFTGTGTTSPITVTGLTNGTAYTFTVKATNAIGTSAASSASNSVTPVTVPGAPTIGTATAGDAQATVTFTAPVSNGGSAITGYTVTSSPGGLTATGTASPITVSGLTNGTAYTFTVTATNARGSSVASSASNSVTPVTVPGAPAIGTATSGNAQATVTFTAPVSNGGSAITGYTVTSSAGGLTATGTASPITVTGLTNGTAYTFTVKASNAVGTGTASAPSNSVTPGTVTSLTSRIWMDKNLGATQVATSSIDAAAYGDLYQWGRGTDGHQIRTSPNTSTLSTTDAPGNVGFILAPSSPYNWRSPQNTNLWQGVNGTNNPCPSGFRLPTDVELDAERATWSAQNAAGAFGSPLKFAVAGYRNSSNGSLNFVGSYGYYWSSTVDGAYSRYLSFYSSSANMYSNYRAYGFSVRCIKD